MLHPPTAPNTAGSQLNLLDCVGVPHQEVCRPLFSIQSVLVQFQLVVKFYPLARGEPLQLNVTARGE